MRKAILIFVVLFCFAITGCGEDKKAHKQLVGDSRISLIEVEGECYLLYHAGFGRGITRTNCP